MVVPPDGPIPAKILICGEAPGAEEERLGKPFVGASGMELDRMLGEAGISRSQCFVTNVCRIRPPNNDIGAFHAKAKKDRTALHRLLNGRYVLQPLYEGVSLLLQEITLVRPNIIIALGNTPLWALTGREGITKWRGSMLYCDRDGKGDPVKVIPTYHPAAVLRQWDFRAIAINDLRRASRFKDGQPYPDPGWKFIIRPSFEDVISCLDRLYIRANHTQPLRISFDLETRAGHIACAGFAWSLTEAICIPFMAGGLQAVWNEGQEAEILFRIYSLLTHPNVRVIGQNLLYDAQYTWKWWRFIPNVDFDTMIGQHACFSALPKGLGFLASMYCNYYVYWKDEGKNI